jgi:hypothetical protein
MQRALKSYWNLLVRWFEKSSLTQSDLQRLENLERRLAQLEDSSRLQS